MKEGDNGSKPTGESSSDASKTSAQLSSPLSSQDLSSAVSQDMPVSSSEFRWSTEMTHSITQSSRRVESSSGNTLDNWTHFDGNNSLHPPDGGNEANNILKELLKDEDGDISDTGHHALLKQILNDKPHDDGNNKHLKQMLGDPSTLQNGSPTNCFGNFQQHQDSSSHLNSYLQNMPDFPIQSGATLKRKIDDMDGAEPGNAPKLAEKNKMLAALLQSTRQQPEIPPAGLPVPNPGDLPQNKLPKDLGNRMMPPVGRNQQRIISSLGNGSSQLPEMMEQNFYSSSSFGELDQSLLELVEDLQELAAHGDSISHGIPFQTSNDKQAIDSIRKNLLEDIPGGLEMQDSIHFREQNLSMAPRYPPIVQGSINPIRQGSVHGFPVGPDAGLMNQQRLSSGHAMLPNQVSPPSRSGIAGDFRNSRSPVPPSNVRQHLRMQSWTRQALRNQQMNGQNPGMQMSNAPPNATLQRSLSIPTSPSFPMNGFQTVQQTNPQFVNQQPLPYSPPPQQQMRFPVPGAQQPLSPVRHTISQPGRNMRPGMWPMPQQQGQQMGQMGNLPQGMIAGGNPMNMPGQQNPPTYPNQQQFINQNGQPFTPHPSQMMQGSPNPPGMQARFPGGNGPQPGQFTQQNMIQQPDQFVNGGNFYPRNSAPAMQQRITNPVQNVQMMRTFVSNLPEEMRPNDGNFSAYQINGSVSSAPPNMNNQQQQFRWDHSNSEQRSNMSMPSTPGINSTGNTRLSNPVMEEQFEQFGAMFGNMDQPGGGGPVSGIGYGTSQPPQQQHTNEPQYMRSFSDQGSMQQSHLQHTNQQQFSSSGSCGDLSTMSHPGNSPGHHMPLDRQKSSSLLQQLLSDNGT